MKFFISEIIKKKRDGSPLSRAEIQFFIKEFLNERIANYQASALLMAIFIRGMNDEETFYLFESMLDCGKKFDLSGIPGKKVDKHSTGGVGDKTSLIVAPLVAACGVVVPMMSGRGLGHTGGTLDKLEAIPGFNVNLDIKKFKAVLKKIGIAMVGQSKDVAPADRKLYALRDVTGTVECIPLIASSIMSKKMAEDLDGLVLDVKFGSGAFMKTFKEAQNLAKTLVMLGQKKKVKTRALLTSMEQPLGTHIGNALEVKEAIDVLKGKGAADLRNLSLQLSAHMLLLASRVPNFEKGLDMAKSALQTGNAYSKFCQLVSLQGGNVQFLENPDLLFKGVKKKEVKTLKDGYIFAMDTEALGMAALVLGAGRSRMEEKIDPGVGFILEKKPGSQCIKGEKLATLFYRDEKKAEEAILRLQNAVTISSKPPAQHVLIQEVVGS